MLQKLFYSLFYFIFSIFIIVWLTATFFLTPIVKYVLTDFDLSLSQQTSITFNPVSMTLDIRDLELQHKKTPLLEFKQLAVDVELFSLLRGKIGLQTVLLKGLKANVEKSGEQILLNSVDVLAIFASEPTQKSNKSPEEEAQSEANKAQKPLIVSVNKVQIDDLAVSFKQPGLESALNLNTLQVHDFSLVDNKIDLSTLIDANVSLRLLAESSAETTSLNTHIRFETTFQLDQTTKDKIPSMLVATEDLVLALKQLNVNAQGYEISNEKFEVTSTQTKLKLLNGEMNDIESDFNVTQQNLIIRPLVETEVTTGDTINLESITVKDVLISNTEGATEFKPKLTVNQIALRALALMHGQDDIPPLTTLDYIDVKQIAVSESLLSVNSINIGELLVNASIQNNKQLSPLYIAETDEASQRPESSVQNEPVSNDVGSESSAENPTSAPENSTMPTIYIGGLQFDTPAIIKFSDKSVSPKYQTQITLEEFHLSELDSIKPAQAAKLIVKLTQDTYTKINLEADLSPFKPVPEYNAKVNIDELSLPELSPYVSSALGYNIESGQMDSKVTVKVINKLLEGNSLTHLKSIELSAAEDTGEKKQISGGAISFNAALGMLKDSDDVVELDIPIKGDLDKPSVGLSGIMSLIIKQATMSAAKDYLITSFLPYSKVIKIAMSAGDHLLKVNFEPLNFDLEQSNIPTAQQDYVKQLGAALTDNKDFNVKLCPVATANELKSKDKAARLELGQKRALQLKQILVNEFKVASKRLYSCAASVDTDKEAKPRIEIEQL